MDPERQEDVVDKQQVHLVGMAERRQYCPSETGNCGVVDGLGLMVQIANSRRVGVVSDRVQRATRQIKKQVVVRLVEKSYRIAFQVMEINLTSPHVTHRHLPSVLPILAIGKIAKRQSDEISVFALDRVAQSQYRVIASSLRNGHVRRAQYARNDCMRLFGSQPLGKPLSVTFTRPHDRPPEQRLIGFNMLTRAGMQFYRSLRTQRFADRTDRAAGACESFQERQIYDEVCTSRSIRPLNYAKQTQFPAARLE